MPMARAIWLSWGSASRSRGDSLRPARLKTFTAYLKDLSSKKRPVIEASDPVPYYTPKVKKPQRAMHEAMRAGLR
jgi:hypothetical protein